MDTQINTTNSSTTTDGLSQETQNQLEVRFQLLPQNIQEMIKNGSYNTALFLVAKENKLTFEELESLQLETVMALFGLSTLDEYKNAITDALKKPAVQMETIMKSLTEKIFDPIKDSLQKFYQTIDEEIAKAEAEDVAEDDMTEDVLSDEIPPEALQSTQNSNPFAGTLDAMPAPVVPVSTVIPIKTSSSVAVPQPASVSTPSSPQFVSNIATNNIGTERILSPNEKRVLGSAGVELGDQQNKMSIPEIEESMLPNRNALIDGIENPVKTASASSTPVVPTAPAPTIVANKLTMSTTLMPNKTTDYSLPKTGAGGGSTIPKTSGDPYREAV